MTHIEMSIEEQPNPQQRPEDVPPSVVVVQRFHCISITGHYVVSLQKVVGKEMIVGQTSRYTIGINIGYTAAGNYKVCICIPVQKVVPVMITSVILVVIFYIN